MRWTAGWRKSWTRPKRGASSDGTGGASAAVWQETRLKEGDILTGTTGTGVLVLAGSVQVSFPAGTVVDVSTGAAVPSGTVLTANHRYLVAEDTTALFAAASKTAVVDYQGPYAFSYSHTTDYNAIAAALKTMHLFQGSFTGYGEGYDLEVAPTRLQALIMFIRVLGEEDEALAYTGSTPFTDIAAGSQAEKYVGYAYSRGYTNGYSATTFRPSQTVTAGQYMEFLLRALGYSSADNKDLSGTLDNAPDERRHHTGGAGLPPERDLPAGGSGLRLLLRPGGPRGRQPADPGRGADGQGRLHRPRGSGGRRGWSPVPGNKTGTTLTGPHTMD